MQSQLINEPGPFMSSRPARNFGGTAYFCAGFQNEHTTGGGLRSLLITGVQIRAADAWLLEKWIQADTRPRPQAHE